MGIRNITYKQINGCVFIIATLLLIVFAGRALAGEAAVQMNDELSVTSTANTVSQAQPDRTGAVITGAAVLKPVIDASTATNALAAQPDPAEAAWLHTLHVSGYAGQTFGMWQNPSTLRDFTPSRNNLAVSRTALQLDENFRLNETNTFFMREWFVYEPPYPWDSANIPIYNAVNANLSNHPSYGHFMNDWYNQYTIRDAWWENKSGPLTTYIGNQIVVWGQSLAFRVGDVINPVDTSWAFGFANLEQSRVPQWMIHPILNLPDYGPLSSNFLELVVQPGFAPQWWSSDYADGRYLGQDTKAARAIDGAPSASHDPSARFDIHYDNQFRPGLNVVLRPNLLTGPFKSPGPLAGIVAAPYAREFMFCTQLVPMIQGASTTHANFADPVPVSMRKPCALNLSKHNDPLGITGDGAIVDIGPWRIPGMQPENWNEGLRFHSLLDGVEWTAFYYNDNTGLGTPRSLRWTPYTNLWTYTYPDIQNVGMTADRPLPVPMEIAESLPLVGRAEVVYKNHESRPSDMRIDSLFGQAYSDQVLWMAATDLDEAYAPWLTATGNLTANFEVFDTIWMDSSKLATWANDVSEPLEKNQLEVLLNLGTSWWWDDFAPTFTGIWAPKGNTLLLFPAIVLNPPWTKKYLLKLQAIEVMGGDRQSVEGGAFKGESLLTAQFQYNFNLL